MNRMSVPKRHLVNQLSGGTIEIIIGYETMAKYSSVNLPKWFEDLRPLPLSSLGLQTGPKLIAMECIGPMGESTNTGFLGVFCFSFFSTWPCCQTIL